MSRTTQLSRQRPAYRTNQATYVAFRANSSTVSTFQITATNPPTITNGWSVDRGNGSGCGSPFVTSTDGTNNMIVWVVGASGDQRLHGYDGDTGAVVFAGGSANETMAGTHSYRHDRHCSSGAYLCSRLTTKSMPSLLRAAYPLRRLRRVQLHHQHQQLRHPPV